MNPDRVLSCAALQDDTHRLESYRQLSERIYEKKEPSLTFAEIQSLVRQLPAEPNTPARAFMWRLLLGVPQNDEIKNLALLCLTRTQDPHRGYALQYLRENYPELLQALLQQYETDPDPSIQYELAQYVKGFDLDRAVDMMIKAIPNASHEVFDSIGFEIQEIGNARHVQELRRKDEEAGGGTGFGRIADALESKLATKGRVI